MRFLYFILLFFPLAAFSQLQVAPVFSSNMILQRDKPVPVWGKAVPGSKVKIRLGDVVRITVAAKDSIWKVYLPKRSATCQPQSMLISCGDTSVQFQNILIGDIWFCIGQGNMEWPMIREKHFNDEIKNSHQPLIRFYNPAYAGKNIYGTAFPDSVVQRLIMGKFYTGQWELCDSNSFKTMSALAYYFGKEIIQYINVPIGLINLAIGGAPLETFIDKNVLKKKSAVCRESKRRLAAE